jgi:hypothetical protein
MAFVSATIVSIIGSLAVDMALVALGTHLHCAHDLQRTGPHRTSPDETGRDPHGVALLTAPRDVGP